MDAGGRYPAHRMPVACMPECGDALDLSAGMHLNPRDDMGAAHEPVDDRDDCLRVTALEMAVKHCAHGSADMVVEAAEKFRAFLAGPEPDTSGDRLGYASMGAERIDMGSRPWDI